MQLSLETRTLVTTGLQDTLRSYGNVTLVPNVKPQVINRISRMTGGPVLPSVNHIDKVLPL